MMWRWFEEWQWNRQIKRAERTMASRPVPEELVKDVLVLPSGKRLEVRYTAPEFRRWPDSLEELFDLPAASDCPEEEL